MMLKYPNFCPCWAAEKIQSNQSKCHPAWTKCPKQRTTCTIILSIRRTMKIYLKIWWPRKVGLQGLMQGCKMAKVVRSWMSYPVTHSQKRHLTKALKIFWKRNRNSLIQKNLRKSPFICLNHYYLYFNSIENVFKTAPLVIRCSDIIKH